MIRLKENVDDEEEMLFHDVSMRLSPRASRYEAMVNREAIGNSEAMAVKQKTVPIHPRQRTKLRVLNRRSLQVSRSIKFNPEKSQAATSDP
jgi:hypothetical protein